MNITDVRLKFINSTEEDSKLRAYVDITFDNCFVVHGLKVIEKQDGLFIAMPSKKLSNGDFKDIVHPIVPEFREQLTKIVLDKYTEELKNL